MRNRKTLPLPDDLIGEILLRLPVKSLVRFRCVSKSWFSRISDPQFAKSQFDISAAAPTHRLFYIPRAGSEARWLDLNTSIKYDYAVVPSPLPYHFNLWIRGSCRGFILLENYPNLILWNPSTGAQKRLSYSPIALSFLNNSHLRTQDGFWCGFGYDSSTDDYLVVIGWHDRRAVNFNTHFEYFSVRTNSWKEIGSTLFSYYGARNQPGLLSNGAIHWLALHRDDESAIIPDKVIIAFDLVARNLSVTPVPNGLLVSSSDDLWVMGGCLSGLYSGVEENEIWMMKEHKGQSFWAKSTVAFPHDVFKTFPLRFTEGGELVATNNCGHLVKFNDKGKVVQLRPDYHDRRTMAMFTETLLSLPCDFGEAREDDH